MVAMIVIVVVLISAVNIVNWYQNDSRLDEALREITQYRADFGQFGNPQDTMAIIPVEGIMDLDSPEFPGPDGSMPPGFYYEDGTPETADSAGDESADREADDSEIQESQEQDETGSSYDTRDDKNADGSRSDFRRPKGRTSALTQYGSRYFIAMIDPEGQVVRVEQQQELVSTEYVQQLVDSMPEDYSEGGYVNGYKYRVMDNFDERTTVCFLDCTTDLRSLQSLLLISVIVGAVGIILAFLFILRMSRTAVEPVRISIEKQKQFITNAGHELKTPLTSIATNMDILTMDLGKNEWVDSTRKQVGKLRRLVENLVSLSRMEEDDTALTMQDFSISDIVHECSETFDSVAAMNGKEIRADITDDLNIQGDPGTVAQLISILCDNAVKYSSGDGIIDIKLYDAGKYICFETSNEWEQNVDDDHIDDLFERFYRGDPSRNSQDKSSGHGLGLSIARAIAEKNSAKLTVETTPGHITFRVRFKK